MYVNPEHQRIMRDVLSQLESANWDAAAEHPGLYETLQSFPSMLAAFPDMSQRFEQEFSQGDSYAYIATVTGTHLGDFMGLAATGREVRFQVIGIEKIVDGKIVHHNAIPDFFSLFMQLGIIAIP